MPAAANTFGSLAPMLKQTYSPKMIVAGASKKKSKFKNLSKYLQK